MQKKIATVALFVISLLSMVTVLTTTIIPVCASPEVRDVAVVDVTPESDWLYQGKLCRANINVTVCNEGNVSETFNVTLYYNMTAGLTIGEQTVTDLLPSNCTTLTFLWDTTGVTPCRNYTITAYAWPVPYEIDQDDNTLEDGIIHVKMLGDVNGDGIIDVTDVYIACVAFGTSLGWPGYNPAVDVNNDGFIDILDLYTVAINFGKTC